MWNLWVGSDASQSSWHSREINRFNAIHLLWLHIVPTSLSGMRRKHESAQVGENKEGETGIEPATSSLGTRRSIVNKEHPRSTACILSISHPRRFSNLPGLSGLMQ